MSWRRRRRRPPKPTSSAHDRFPPATSGRWSISARDDPITGLIAWPGFFAALPARLAQSLTSGRSLGIAIGDVDHLKDYVERTRAADAESFGHLAGNALMTRLGTVARHWLLKRGPAHACLATFGGDEIILVADVDDETAFMIQTHELRDALCASLPCTVSFAATVVTPGPIPAVVGDHWWTEFTTQTIGEIEQTLFAHKHARSAKPGSTPAGFVEFVGEPGCHSSP